VNRMLKPKDRTKEIGGMKCLLLDRETVRVRGAPRRPPRGLPRRGWRTPRRARSPRLGSGDRGGRHPGDELVTTTPPPLLSSVAQRVIVSMVCGMNEVLKKDVLLVEAVDAEHKAMGHLKVRPPPLPPLILLPCCVSTVPQAVILVRPTAENISILVAHLKAPRFCEYHLFFSNVLPGDYLRRLADADTSFVVKQVQVRAAAVHTTTATGAGAGGMAALRSLSPPISSAPLRCRSFTRTTWR